MMEIIRIDGGTAHVLYVASSRRKLYDKYRDYCERGALVRLRIDGRVLRIYEADRLVNGKDKHSVAGGKKGVNRHETNL